MYRRSTAEGGGSPPFSAVTAPPIEQPPVSYREQIIIESRKQFTAPRTGVEEAVAKELMESLASPAPLDARMKKKPAQYAAEARQERMTQHTETGSAGGPSFAPRREMSRPPLPREQGSQTSLPPRQPSTQPEMGKLNFPKRESLTFPSREPEPRRMVQERPMPVTKSPEDLKAILRTMTTKGSAEREQKQTQNQQSLKGALAGILEKNEKTESPVAVKPSREIPVPPLTPQEKKPFEVPEDALRKILKGES